MRERDEKSGEMSEAKGKKRGAAEYAEQAGLKTGELLQLAKALGYTRLTAVHEKWMLQMVYGQRDMTLQAHRGSYKTTCLCVALAVMMTEMGGKNILFMRKTDGDVAEVLRQVSGILKHEAMRAWCERRTGKELKVIRATTCEISTGMYTAPRGAPQLLGMGTGGSLTGKHADVIVTDDIVNLKDRLSRAEREHTKSIYRELQNIRNRGGRIINTGTPWHRDDCFSLMPKALKYDYRKTKLISRREAAELRRAMTPGLFAANYELRHIAEENALFGEMPVMFDDEELLRDGIAHIDAAYGGGDCTALTCMSRIGDEIYVYGRLWHCHVDAALNAILNECDRMLCQPVWCETNADKGFLAREIREKGYAARMYHESQNKYYKISTFLRKWWGNIRFYEETDAEYLEQIAEYSEEAEADDAPDSCATALRILTR